MESLPSQYVDTSKFPPDEKAHILELAEKHNALCLDVDGISGRTEAEKQEFHGIMGILRKTCAFVHSKRFQVLVGLISTHYGLAILSQMGIKLEFLQDAAAILHKLAATP